MTTSQIIASAHSPQLHLDKIRDYIFPLRQPCPTRSVAERSDILFLAVKPNKFAEVIPQISGHHVKPGRVIVVSIAAGQPIAAIEALLRRTGQSLIRAMPNTPALSRRGDECTLCVNRQGDPGGSKSSLRHSFNCFGRCGSCTGEALMDAVVGVSGSSPAYVYMFIEAMADAAVADGMPRAQAYKFAAQSVLGAAKMVLETGKHPGELKDAVCSPGGTTIEAVCRAFRTLAVSVIL